MINKALKYNLLFWLLLILCHNTKAQGNNEPVVDKDLWYVWLDATATIDGSKKYVVSEKLQEVYCCIRSRRYRKYIKKIERELKEKVSDNFTLGSQLKKVNHPVLAKEMLEKAKSRDNVFIINWKASCP